MAGRSRARPGHLRAGAARGPVARGAQPLLAPALSVRVGPRAAARPAPRPVSPVQVRSARPTSAAILAEMANDLNDHVGILGRPFTLERSAPTASAPGGLHSPGGRAATAVVVGYAFFSPGTTPTSRRTASWLHDIFVAPAAAGRGVGHALMAASRRKRCASGVALEWGVHPANAGALEFYRRLGARGADVRVMGWTGSAAGAGRAEVRPAAPVADRDQASTAAAG